MNRRVNNQMRRHVDIGVGIAHFQGTFAGALFMRICDVPIHVALRVLSGRTA